MTMAFCIRQLLGIQQPIPKLSSGSKIAMKTNMMPGFLKLEGPIHRQIWFTMRQMHGTKDCTLATTKEPSIELGHEIIKQNIGCHVSRSGNLSQGSRILSSTLTTCSILSSCGSFFSHLDSMCHTHSHFVPRTFSTAAPLLSSNGSDKMSPSQIQLDLDLERSMSSQNLESLQKNLSARGSGFNLDQLVADYRRWRKLKALKTSLETERTNIAKRMAYLVKDKMSEENVGEKEELMARGKAIKEQMKDVKSFWWTAEHKVMTQALQLPTDLHPLTPHTEDQSVHVWKGTVKDPGHVNHVQFAEQCGLLKFSMVGPRAVYLLGEMAELEQSLLHCAATCLSVRGYSPFASPEMFRSLVVEGCGMEPEDVLSLQMKEEERETNAYYLKGTSLLSYAAFLTRVRVRQDCLPLMMYSMGRHYRPSTGEDLPGLYGPVQSTRVTMFGAAQCGDQTTEIHDNMVTVAWDLVQHLGLPARKMVMSARNLQPSESLRTEVQVWAPGVQQYVPMACVSIHNDYASRRLMSKASNGRPLHTVSGIALDTAVVLASVLEHSRAQGGIRLLSLPDTTKDSSNKGGQRHF